MKNRPYTRLGLALLLSVVLISCSTPQTNTPLGPTASALLPTPTPPESALWGGTLTIAIPLPEATVFNPLTAETVSEWYITNLLFNPLVLGSEGWGTETTGELAERWEVSDDGLTWTFHLRRDVRWHDGVPLTSQDVLFTFAMIQDPNSGSRFRGRFLQDGDPILFTALDDYTVQVHLRRPQPTLVPDIGVAILPAHLLAGKGNSTADFEIHPIGTGPFKLEGLEPGKAITLTANADYFRGRPYLDRIVLWMPPDDDALLSALRDGQVDIALLKPELTPKLKDWTGGTVRVQSWDTMWQLRLNNQHPLLQDKRVRQAIALALDRQALVASVFQGYATAADSVFNQTVFTYVPHDPTLPQYLYDLDKARGLLASAGWVRRSDGLRYKDEQPLRLPLLQGADYFSSAIGDLVRENLAAVGIDVPVQRVNDPESAIREGDFVLCLGCWSLLGPDPGNYAAWIYHGPASENVLNYENPRVDWLFDRAQSTQDAEQRRVIYKDLERALLEDLPIIPLVYPMSIFAVSNRVVMDQAIFDVNRIPPFRHPERIWLRQP